MKFIRTLTAALLSVPLALAMIALGQSPASAQYADDGSGAYLGTIDWLEWGHSGQTLSTTGAPYTVTNTTSVGGHTLATKCTISDLTKNVVAYNPLGWGRSGINTLYKGSGLINGLSTGSGTATFDLSCSATFDGDPYPLPGLVMADAEQSASNEWVQITAPSPATVQVIDRTRAAGCTASALATATKVDYDGSNTGTEVRLSNSGTCASGPSAVTYVNATEAKVALKGGGVSAVAVGVLLAQEWSDGPESYGEAGYLIAPTVTGGTVPTPASVGDPAITTNISDSSFAPGTFTEGKATLGSGQTFEGAAQTSDTATGDSDDAFATPPAIDGVSPGDTYTLDVPVMRHTTTLAVLRGFIDWNGNGTFENTEVSDPPSGSGTFIPGNTPGATRTLTWTVPSDVSQSPNGGSLLRLRLAAPALLPAQSIDSASSPTGLWAQANTTVGNASNATGEVEDYMIAINVPINAMADDFTDDSLPTTGGMTPTVFTNDTVGDDPATDANVTVTLTDDGGLDGATMNPDGTITIPSGVSAGTYELSYKICQTAAPTSCSAATVRISIFDKPAAEPDTVLTEPETPVTFSPIDNDTPSTGNTVDPASLVLIDPETGEPTLSVTTDAGTYEVTGDEGEITFTPAAGWTGTDDSITYQFTDTSGQIATSTITTTTSAIIDIPLFNTVGIAAGLVLAFMAAVIARRWRRA